jgi:hypothetical protein
MALQEVPYHFRIARQSELEKSGFLQPVDFDAALCKNLEGAFDSTPCLQLRTALSLRAVSGGSPLLNVAW